MGENQPSLGLFKSLFVTYAILVLHGVVIILFALLVVFFRGVVEYLPWIMLGGFLLLASFVWLLWHKLRRSRAGLGALLDSPGLRDRSVEVKFLGGVASLRLGAPRQELHTQEAIMAPEPAATPHLEDAETQRLRRLARLIKLRDAGEISDDEYQSLRQEMTATAAAATDSTTLIN